ncbi:MULTISPECIES: Wzz/FepE/Etk N-terminal domain-containing protein [unclassified Pseudomonas]|uniref:Wzz/FepE/Etk N-terminal domain-containing protein n=1 Tax=unclassified Pseudomonas TaxID=196821 RepID=UPI0021C57BA7|nr:MULTISPECIES: Wzz/FepE/Etk N-terminal domain-containing protein [unclassified Pseudomonas]MCU1733997.1 Wzz/FepE/Etk N-terminal domain-containing protein [Pseudomonas sp. 20P_3.2_Bac4]MCU1742335.1 Wzz/FepE/Etk N-terminal domain-containing protein [Pseudomonas sp. 20P_3.2_Bac5]
MRNDRECRDKDHEIDLLAMLELLWRQRAVVFVIVFLAVALSLFYIVVRVPVYEAKAIVEAPAQENISQLNYGRGGESGLPLLTTGDVYEIYVHHLLSESQRRKFFESVYLPQLSEVQRRGAVEDLYRGFARLLQVVQLSKSPARYSVSVKLPDPEQAALWVKQYIEMAEVAAKAEVLENVRSDASTRAENLRREITAERETAKRKREDREARLREALAVARSIGLHRPLALSGEVAAELSPGRVGVLSYMRGSDALGAEIESLEARASDDPFIDGLRERQVELEFYSALKILPSTIAVYRQDGAIGVPDRSILPSGVLVVVVGSLLGVVVGVASVLMWYLISVAFLSPDNGNHGKRRRHGGGDSGQVL